MAYVDEHPEPSTSKPERPLPLPLDATREERLEHQRQTDIYNAWVLSFRRHVVAKALDEMMNVGSKETKPSDTIVFVLGVSWLEESSSQSTKTDPFSAIFGRLL